MVRDDNDDGGGKTRAVIKPIWLFLAGSPAPGSEKSVITEFGVGGNCGPTIVCAGCGDLRLTTSFSQVKLKAITSASAMAPMTR